MSLQSLPAHARIWIYQSPRPLTDGEIRFINEVSLPFLKEWTSHKMSMDAALEVRHERFVILAVDEQTAPASGCGIDDSIRFIKAVSDKMGLDLLDRSLVYFRKGDAIASVSLSDLGNGEVKPDTIVFNNLIERLGAIHNAWEVKAKDCWVGNFIS
ncbi:MAG: ABC transporter ATPase [Bacteroidia bacterium]|nr:ABC transporter ATPase [Bacteroidia bacterium]